MLPIETIRSFSSSVKEANVVTDVASGAKKVKVPKFKGRDALMATLGAAGLYGIQRGIKDIQMGEQVRRQQREGGY